MAYRTADHERWKQLDFIMGQEVHTSKSHKCDDICDQLAGKYPKEFKFVGWHPQCLCFCVPLLSDKNEIDKMIDAFNEGKEYTPQGDKVTKLPSNFTKWVDKNADRIEKAQRRGSLPYFLKDNEGFMTYSLLDKIMKHSYKLIPENAILSRKDFNKIRPSLERMRTKDIFHYNTHEERDALIKNFEEISKVLYGKVVDFNPMDIFMANKKRCNPNFIFGKLGDFELNCQMCVIVYELRRRGFDLEALGYFQSKNAKKLGDNINNGFFSIFDKSIGSTKELSQTKEKTILDQFNDATSANGRYIIGLNQGEHGHVLIYERWDKICVGYDPQMGEFVNFGDWLNTKDFIEVTRIDNLKINPNIVRSISKFRIK